MVEETIIQETEEEKAERERAETAAAAEGERLKSEQVITPETTEGISPEDIVSGKKPAEDKTPAWARQRFDELTREKYALKEEAERLRKELAVKSIPAERPLPPDSPRFENEYEGSEDYRKSQADYKKAFMEWKDKDDAWKEQQKKVDLAAINYQQHEKELFDNFDKRSESMRQKYPDFDSVVVDFIPATPDGNHLFFRDELLENERGPEIGYYLAKNPKEMMRILNLSQRGIIKEITMLEQRFNVAAGKTQSNAPAPINTVKGNEEPPVDTSKMSDEEWAAWNKQQRLKKLGAAK